MTQKTKKPHSAITNRRASYDYYLSDELVVGLVLTGPEVRAARDGHVQLKGSYVTIKDNELWLINASFSVKNNLKGEPNQRTVDNKNRKLLASRKQIEALIAQKKAGLTIVPTKLLTNGRYLKLVIFLGKGKKNYDKREVIKKRDFERERQKGL